MPPRPMAQLSDPDRLIARFHTAAELWTAGVTLHRQTLHRRHPDSSVEEIEALLNQWLQQRPGAEMGDGPQPDQPRRA